MCKCIEKLQTFCINSEINVSPWTGSLVIRCTECDENVELEGLGPDYPIAPIDETYEAEEV